MAKSHPAGMRICYAIFAGISLRLCSISLRSFRITFAAYLPTHIKFLTEFHRIFFGTTCISFLKLIERRGSGMKKIIGEYQRYDNLKSYHAPEFSSNTSEFHAVLWNLNYETSVKKEFVKEDAKFVKEFVKEDAKFTKEFIKAQRIIYKLISEQPQISAAAMAEKIGISSRQVQKYLKRLTDLQLIIREGGRKNGFWKIIDNDYEDFFKRI